jgi:hypothetical protein
MAQASTQTHPPDIALLLRVYGEQRWLLREVMPVLREAECPGAISEDDLSAAMAYLEMLWSQALRLAQETDAVAEGLDPSDSRCSHVLVGKAQRYHAAIGRLRVGMATRVQKLTAPIAPPLPHEHASH